MPEKFEPKKEELSLAETELRQGTKMIFDFAKEHGNGWIFINSADSADACRIEAGTVWGHGPKVTMSATIGLEEIFRLFDLTYYDYEEGSKEPGTDAPIHSLDEFREALNRHEQINAYLKEAKSPDKPERGEPFRRPTIKERY